MLSITISPTALGMAKTQSFGHSECKRVKVNGYIPCFAISFTKGNNFLGVLFALLDDEALKG